MPLDAPLDFGCLDFIQFHPTQGDGEPSTEMQSLGEGSKYGQLGTIAPGKSHVQNEARQVLLSNGSATQQPHGDLKQDPRFAFQDPDWACLKNHVAVLWYGVTSTCPKKGGGILRHGDINGDRPDSCRAPPQLEPANQAMHEGKLWRTSAGLKKTKAGCHV